MNKQSMVEEFMRAAGQNVPNNLCKPPNEPPHRVRVLRIKLVREEALELLAALEYDLDIPVVADAVADLLYVVYGTAAAYGIKIDPVFGEVHRSNMTKFIDGHRREDGKWMKGPSWEPPRILEILDAQNG